ncbi:hypothetical protein LCGC14_1060200 [marine sediment metagenome]|uniref:Uncharacterized protein n=1 Tax=marine sediment metagenome TaxID=412755 RepID=A0A0F9MLF2_9ZZZZ
MSIQSQFKFVQPINFFELEEKGQKRFFIKGDFSNTEKDLVNDICTMACLKSMIEQMKSRSIKLDFEHESIRGESNLEKEANKTRLPVGKAIEANMRGSSAEAVWELNEGYKKFNSNGDIVMDIKDIKANIKSEMLDAFSIGYIPTKFNFVMKDGEQVRMLDEIRVISIALTGSAINTGAQIKHVFAKSLTALEEFEKERKANPEIEDEVEVKATSPQERRTRARKEAIKEDDDDDDEEDSNGKKKKKEEKAYEPDGAHAHTTQKPLGLHNHPEIENQIRIQVDMLYNRVNFLSERLFETVEDSAEPAMVAVKSKLIESKSFNVGGQDKLFRDGKEIDPKTNQPYSSPLGDSKIKLEDNNMSDEDNAKKPVEGQPAEGAPAPAEGKPAEGTDSQPEGTKAPEGEGSQPAAPAEEKAMSEIKSLKDQIAELKSTVDVVMKALSKSIGGTAVQDTNPQLDLTEGGPQHVLELCR